MDRKEELQILIRAINDRLATENKNFPFYDSAKSTQKHYDTIQKYQKQQNLYIEEYIHLISK